MPNSLIGEVSTGNAEVYQVGSGTAAEETLQTPINTTIYGGFEHYYKYYFKLTIMYYLLFS